MPATDDRTLARDVWSDRRGVAVALNAALTERLETLRFIVEHVGVEALRVELTHLRLGIGNVGGTAAMLAAHRGHLDVVK